MQRSLPALSALQQTFFIFSKNFLLAVGRLKVACTGVEQAAGALRHKTLHIDKTLLFTCEMHA
jgi:hypothetical protein